MLRSLKKLRGVRVQALDGPMGKIHDFYFSDQSWKIRYLVDNAGSWLKGHLVLISPDALMQPDWDNHIFPVRLSREEVRQCPNADSDKPVSLQQQWDMRWRSSELFATHYMGDDLGPVHIVEPLPTGHEPEPDVNNDDAARAEHKKPAGDPHLRSVELLMDYHIHATDGVLGRLIDMIVEDDNWELRYLEIDTRNLWPGKKVLIPVEMCERISWDEQEIFITTDCETVKSAPEFNPSIPLDDDTETALCNHYHAHI